MLVIITAIWMISIFEKVLSSEIVPENRQQHEYRSSRFTVGFHVLLPVAGLILIVLGRKQILEKLLLQLDKRYLTLFCPRFIKREALLKWAGTRLPPTWSSHSTKTLSGGIKELWTDGSLLCTLINTAVPGACPNPHRHWKQPPVHAQALAYKYFGVVPIFTNEDLKKNLNSTFDRRFLGYLTEIQQATNKSSENTDKDHKISERYIARGMGLFSGEQFKTTIFYIYLNENCDDDNESNIIIQIKGPFGSFGEACSPKLINKKRKRRRKIKTDRRPSIKLIENLQSLQSNINNLSWNFKRSQKKAPSEEIDVEATMENERIKVCYVPKNYGMYEINMVAGGEVLKGCPFNVHIFVNDSNEDEVAMKKLRHPRTVRKLIGTTEEKTSLHGRQSIMDDTIHEEKRVSTKSTFNFQEVVDEITKNGAVFKNILGDDPESGATGKLEVSTRNKHTENDNEEIQLLNEYKKDNNISDMTVKNEINDVNTSPKSLKLHRTVNHQSLINNYNIKPEMSVNNIKTIQKNHVNMFHIAKFVDSTEEDAKFSNAEELTDEIYNKKSEEETDTSVDKSRANLNAKFLKLKETIELKIDAEDKTNKTNKETNKKILEEETTIATSTFNKNINISKETRKDAKTEVTGPKIKFSNKEDQNSKTEIIDKHTNTSNFSNEKSEELKTSADVKSSCKAELRNNTDNESNKIISEEKPVNDESINANKYILNKQISDGSNNFKANNALSEQIFTNKDLITATEKKQLDHNIMKYVFEPKYIENMNINKVKIPERFVDNPVKNVPYRLDDKYFKNILNESNKVTRKITNIEPTLELAKNTDIPDSYEVQNNTKNKSLEFRRYDDYEIDNTIKNRVQAYLEKLEKDTKYYTKDTSPICCEHIANEVEYRQRTVAERRKIFAQSSLESESNSKNSSFSDNENSLGSSIKKFQIQGLTITNVLNDLKEATTSPRTSWSLCSTVSLPNLSLESEWSSISSVKDKKSFWENISSTSSSAKSLSPKKVKTTLSELERSKLIWKKPEECVSKDQENHYPSDNLYKSADDILSMTESLAHHNTKKYQSVDDSLDKCAELSIEERKKMLLRQAYEDEKDNKEVTRRKKIVRNTVVAKDIPKVDEEDKFEVRFPPISERIKRYKSALQLSTEDTTKNLPKTIRKAKSFQNPTNLKKKEDTGTPSGAKRHQFNKAIRYFKNLETQSQTIKSKARTTESETPSSRYRSATLNLPKVSQKFSVNNLYDDVFGNNKGSFKGTPNRSALVEALATFTRNPSYLEKSEDTEDDIKYEIFKHAKRRKRNSLHSVFGIHY